MYYQTFIFLLFHFFLFFLFVSILIFVLDSISYHDGKHVHGLVTSVETKISQSYTQVVLRKPSCIFKTVYVLANV